MVVAKQSNCCTAKAEAEAEAPLKAHRRANWEGAFFGLLISRWFHAHLSRMAWLQLSWLMVHGRVPLLSPQPPTDLPRLFFFPCTVYRGVEWSGVE